MSHRGKVAAAGAAFLLSFSVAMAPAMALGTINRTTAGCAWQTTVNYFSDSAGTRGITGTTNNGCSRYVSVQVSSYYNGSR